METIAADLEQRLRAHRLEGLLPPALEDEFVVPHYGGYSLLNVPATLAHLLGVRLRRVAPPLADAYWHPCRDGVRRIILVLLDALGYGRLRQAMSRLSGELWARLADRGLLLPMTSVYPSTTSTALTCLLTGASPLTHGALGYELWLREYGLLTEMLSMKPALGGKGETLLDWGFVPEEFLPVASVAGRLQRVGVRTVGLVPAPFRGSALTRMLYQGFTRLIGYRTAGEMWSRAAAELGRDGPDPALYLLYWGGIDGAIHRHGSADGYWEAQLRAATRGCETEFLARLDAAQRGGTLFILVADHGFVDAPADLAHDTEADPVFRERLLIPYSGESRAAYLHCYDGGSDEARRAIQSTLGSGYVVLPTAAAVDAGLFGYGEPAREARSRLGHLQVLPRGLRYLDRRNKRAELRGRHGGLSAEEMLVPWLAVRLDD